MTGFCISKFTDQHSGYANSSSVAWVDAYVWDTHSQYETCDTTHSLLTLHNEDGISISTRVRTADLQHVRLT
eukprot:5148075-Pleurochrysis_carterae.AAC.1